MTDPMMDHATENAAEPLAVLRASPVRRGFAYGAVVIFGAMLILLAFAQPPALLWQLFLLGLGVFALVVAEWLRRATALALVLTETDLRDTNGAVLTRLDNIVSVDRGAFAFKPSNGFVLRLARPMPRAWAPGVYWRVATRIGVGGATPSGPGKYMAEQIALRLKSET